MKLSELILDLTLSDNYRPEYKRSNEPRHGSEYRYICPVLCTMARDGALAHTHMEFLCTAIEQRTHYSGTLLNHLVHTKRIGHVEVTKAMCQDWWLGFAAELENQGH